MKALISPIEIQPDGNARVCEVSESTFPVAEPLFWVKCTKNISGGTHTYNLSEKKFVQIEQISFELIGSLVATEPQPVTTGTVDL